MPSTVQARRLAHLKAAVDALYIETATDTVGGEDLAPYLAGEVPCARWCAVTSTGGSDGIRYAYPWCATLARARERLIEHVGDDIYAEYPHAVVDLDTGRVRRPRWGRLTLLRATEVVRGA